MSLKLSFNNGETECIQDLQTSDRVEAQGFKSCDCLRRDCEKSSWSIDMRVNYQDQLRVLHAKLLLEI
jgi:hypothetical protein